MDSPIVSVEDLTPSTPANQSFVKDDIGPLASFLGADSQTDADKLQTIVDYLKTTEKDLTDITLLHNVRSIETRLGLPKLGEARLDRIYAYVKLQSQAKETEKQIQELLR